MRWRSWDGDIAPPVKKDVLVHMRFRSGLETVARRAGAYRWTHRNEPGDIIAWRLA